MQWIVLLVSLILIHWTVIYPVDSAIQLLDSWGLSYKCYNLIYHYIFSGKILWDRRDARLLTRQLPPGLLQLVC